MNNESSSICVDPAYQQCATAIGRFLEKSAVALIIEKSGEPSEIASGTCIEINGKRLIATAAHVVSGVNAGELCIHAQTDAPDELIFHPRAMRTGWRGGSSDDPIDVGWIELLDNDTDRLSSEFQPLGRLLPCVNYEEPFVTVYGYPSALINEDALRKQELRLRPTAIHGFTHSPEIWLPEYDRTIDLVIDYPPSANVIELGENRPLPFPHGMSGGGIWASRFSRDTIWTLNRLSLIGLQHSWKRDREWIRGTQIQHWLKMVGEDHPELSHSIQAHLGNRV